MLCSSYFTELFLTRSWARPRLLFAVQRSYEWGFFSSPQQQNPYDGKVRASFHMKLSKDMCPEGFRSVAFTSGLFYFSSMKMSQNKDEDAVPVIFNPTTRQYDSLPKLSRHIYSESFLGFDPIDKQFKVLSIAKNRDDHRILTLATGKMRWRKIKFSLAHEPWTGVICIKGVLYYLAKKNDGRSHMIVCFDVRSEKFKVIEVEWFYEKLINYKGKLGAIELKYEDNTCELCVRILEDVEKQYEWSRYVYALEIANYSYVSVAGVTATGEIVLSVYLTSFSPVYVFYFNPERKTFQRVEVQGFGKYYHENLHYVCASVDNVEDLHVTDAKYLKPMPKYL